MNFFRILKDLQSHLWVKDDHLQMMILPTIHFHILLMEKNAHHYHYLHQPLHYQKNQQIFLIQPLHPHQSPMIQALI